ncbi:MAG: hypothetical protein AAF721_34375 [Myxococcota bacterium]
MERWKSVLGGLVLFASASGCDEGGGSSNPATGPRLDELVGYWTQVSCSDDQGNEVDCYKPLSYVRRDLEFDADGTVTHYFAVMGGAAEPGTTGAWYEPGEICNEEVGCYALTMVDGALIYCLTSTACEMFEK